jgi:hypothetical protein
MQFKHPEFLYALILLIIPIIVHLFQLRRFQKVEFTNVKFLKSIIQQSRKSSILKKWLVLCTRLMIYALIILAFAQPYTAVNDNFTAKSETVIYLDNSFSMQANSNNGTLLNKAIQELLASVDTKDEFSLFTNNNTFKKTTVNAIKNDIIQLDYSPKQLSYDAVLLNAKQLFSKDKNTLKNLVVISDFQQKENPLPAPTDSTFTTKIVQLLPTNTYNISIDTVYISNTTIDNLELTVKLSNQGETTNNLPVSLYNADNLIAKSALTFENEATTSFTIQNNQLFNGKISIEDSNLQYDNALYFNINNSDKIKVLAINQTDDSFLNKLYTDDEFEYLSAPINSLNYNSIDEQNLIILNEIKDPLNALIMALKRFKSNGGTIIIIPSDELILSSYNQLLNTLSNNVFANQIENEKRVTTINFSHPLLTNVFDKKVSNFQYPKVSAYFNSSSPFNSNILSFEDNTPFLFNYEQVYVFTAALNDNNSNFKYSPLIVPVFYNIGKQSLKIPQLYYTIGNEHKIDIKTQLKQDDILTLRDNNGSVIPQQQTYTNKVELITNEYPENDGIISVYNKDQLLNYLSFNYNRDESQLTYYSVSSNSNQTIENSIEKAIDEIKSSTFVNELWKWFVIFALAFLVIEMLILKFLK